MSHKLPIRVPVIPECEIFQEGGEGGENMEGKCKKNPGHPNFYPVAEFEKHLPENMRTKDLIDSIHFMISRTVRISVKYTSKLRPLVYPGTDAMYPFSKFRGSSRLARSGTGFIIADLIKPILRTGKPCRCHPCKASEQPQMREYTIFVYTSTHVVFDDSEASCAVFECFFDTIDRSGVELLYGVSVKNDVETDGAEILCVTHDDDVITKLNLTDTVVEVPLAGSEMEQTNIDRNAMSDGETEDDGKDQNEKEIGIQNVDGLTESMGDEKETLDKGGDIEDETRMADISQTKHSENEMTGDDTDCAGKKLSEVNLNEDGNICVDDELPEGDDSVGDDSEDGDIKDDHLEDDDVKDYPLEDDDVNDDHLEDDDVEDDHLEDDEVEDDHLEDDDVKDDHLEDDDVEDDHLEDDDVKDDHLADDDVKDDHLEDDDVNDDHLEDDDVKDYPLDDDDVKDDPLEDDDVNDDHLEDDDVKDDHLEDDDVEDDHLEDDDVKDDHLADDDVKDDHLEDDDVNDDHLEDDDVKDYPLDDDDMKDDPLEDDDVNDDHLDDDDVKDDHLEDDDVEDDHLEDDEVKDDHLEDDEVKDDHLEDDDVKDDHLEDDELERVDSEDNDLEDDDLENNDLEDDDLVNNDLEDDDLVNDDLEDDDLVNDDLEDDDLVNNDYEYAQQLDFLKTMREESAVMEDNVSNTLELYNDLITYTQNLFPGGLSLLDGAFEMVVAQISDTMNRPAVIEPVDETNKEGNIYTVVVVSHPHGCSKKVSFGKILGYQVVVDDKITPGEPNSFFADTVCHLPLPTEPDQPWPICLSPEFPLKPGQSALIPSEMKYIIPPNSEYLYKINWTSAKTQNNSLAKSALDNVYEVAKTSGLNRYRRFDIFKTFPPGTRYSLHGKEISIPPEAEFYSDIRINDSTGSKASFMMYDIPTCPGSSGALVNVTSSGINIPMLCPTHQGLHRHNGTNISSIDTGHIWFSIFK